MTDIAKSVKIYKNVTIGKDVVIEDFSVIGIPPRGYEEGELETVIGDNAIIRSHTVIYAGNKIGKNFQTGNKANIRELNDIGDDVSVGTLSVIEHHVRISDKVRIHSQAFIPEYTILHESVWIGPNVVITNAKYPMSPNSKNELKGVNIEHGAIIGANSTLLPGISVGKHSLIGAGSVVTKSVDPKVVVAGNPATKISETTNLPY